MSNAMTPLTWAPTEPGPTAALQRRAAAASKGPRGSAPEPSGLSFDALLRQAAPGSERPGPSEIEPSTMDTGIEAPQESATERALPEYESGTQALDWSALVPSSFLPATPQAQPPVVNIPGESSSTAPAEEADLLPAESMRINASAPADRDLTLASPAVSAAYNAPADRQDEAREPTSVFAVKDSATALAASIASQNVPEADQPGRASPAPAPETLSAQPPATLASSPAVTAAELASQPLNSTPAAGPSHPVPEPSLAEAQAARPLAVNAAAFALSRMSEARGMGARATETRSAEGRPTEAVVVRQANTTTRPLEVPTAEPAQRLGRGPQAKLEANGSAQSVADSAASLTAAAPAPAVGSGSPGPAAVAAAPPIAVPAPLVERFESPVPQGYTPAQVETPITDHDFPRVLGMKIGQWVNDEVQQVWLDVHPADMGPVAIQIALDGQQAELNFGVESAAARQVIEASLPELASALQSAGLTLSGGSISQDMPQSRPGADPENPRGTASASRQAAAGATGGADLADGFRPSRAGLGLLDLYA